MTDCLECPTPLTDDNLGCYVDQLCNEHAPALGRCLDCADMRREDVADFMFRYALENEVCS